MNNVQVVSHKQRLDDLFEKVRHFNHDQELMSHWSRYLCVLVSGFIEKSVRTIILDYADRKSSPEIAYFIGHQLRDFQNPKMNKILDLAAEFKQEYRSVLESATEGEHKAAIDSVVSNRHRIAHGESTGVSYVAIKGWYDRVVEVIEEVEDCFET